MIITDLFSRNRLSPKVFSKRIKGVNFLNLVADKEIWRPKPGETLMVVAGWINCREQRGADTGVNRFELEVNNVDVVASVAGPTNIGATNRLAIASQTVFTNALPLTFTLTVIETGSLLKEDLILIAIKI